MFASRQKMNFQPPFGRPHEGFLLFSPFFRGHWEIYREFYKTFSVRNVSVSRGDIVGYSSCTVTLDWNLACIEMWALRKSAVMGAAMSMEEEKPATFCFRKKETVNAPQAHRVYLRYFAYWRCFPHLRCFASLRYFACLRCLAYTWDALLSWGTLITWGALVTWYALLTWVAFLMSGALLTRR